MSLRSQLPAIAFTRMVLNTAFRMLYPFLPAFSRGLGVPLETLTVWVSLRSGLGLVAPAFGAIPDRIGRRASMLSGLAIFGVSVGVVALFPSPLTFFIMIIGVAAGKQLFDTALLAFIGDRTPYARRGLVVAVSELGWSGAFLLGIPLVGFILARAIWSGVFWPFVLGGLIAFGLMAWLIPNYAINSTVPVTDLRQWLGVIRQPHILGALSIGMLGSAANETLNVVYGGWLENAFNLTVVQLGLTVTVIGLAELTGEGVVMAFADRWGKRNLIMLGVSASAVAYLVLPWLSFNVNAAAVGLFLIYLTFEITVGSSIPFVTELNPQARGLILGSNLAGQGIGRMVGALLGGQLFALGIGWTGAVAALLNVLVLVIIWRVVRKE